ncbi:MAG: DUF4214 domain-containing protein [Burkholderiales bacterium]|nr:DUF4214 domain-containing protein [Burkholderiales bacterium]
MGQNIDSIQQLYIAYFGRPADTGGLQYWHDVVANNGGDLGAVSAAFSTSPEYKALVAGKSNTAIVENIYQQLFGHKPDAGGLAFWANQLDSGNMTVDKASAEIMHGAQGSDLVAVNVKVGAAMEFTNSLLANNAGKDYSTASAAKFAHDLLAKVTDVTSFSTFMSSLKSTVLGELTHANIAVGEPNPNGNGVAVGEPNPNQGVAVGEPNPNQGIAVGEPNPGHQGIAVGEPNPGHAQGFAIGEPNPGHLTDVIGMQQVYVSFM